MNWTSFSTLAGNGTWQSFKDVFYLLSLVVALLLYRDHLSSRSFDRTNLLLDYFELQISERIATFNTEFNEVMTDTDYKLLIQNYQLFIYEACQIVLKGSLQRVDIEKLRANLGYFSQTAADNIITDLKSLDLTMDKKRLDDKLKQIATVYAVKFAAVNVMQVFKALDFNYNHLLMKLNRLGLYIAMSNRMMHWRFVSEQLEPALTEFWAIPKYQMIFEFVDNNSLIGLKVLKQKYGRMRP